MNTTMRQAFEDCAVPKNPTSGQREVALLIINRMNRQDANAEARRKRVRKTPAVPELRQ